MSPKGYPVRKLKIRLHETKPSGGESTNEIQFLDHNNKYSKEKDSRTANIQLFFLIIKMRRLKIQTFRHQQHLPMKISSIKNRVSQEQLA